MQGSIIPEAKIILHKENVNAFFTLLLLILKIRKAIVTITKIKTTLRRKYSLRIGRVAKRNFANASAAPVTKDERIVEILKL